MKTRLSLLFVLIGLIGVAACDSSSPRGIATLGKGFVRVFYMDRNAEPVDAQSVKMTLTPTIEPFNP